MVKCHPNEPNNFPAAIIRTKCTSNHHTHKQYKFQHTNTNPNTNTNTYTSTQIHTNTHIHTTTNTHTYTPTQIHKQRACCHPGTTPLCCQIHLIQSLYTNVWCKQQSLVCPFRITPYVMPPYKHVCIYVTSYVCSCECVHVYARSHAQSHVEPKGHGKECFCCFVTLR